MRPHSLITQAIAIIFAGLVSAHALASESPNIQGKLRTPPKAQQFNSIFVESKAALAQLLPLRMADQIWGMLKKYKCDSTGLTVYFNQRSSSKVVESSCHRLIQPASKNIGAIYEIEFPIMIAIEGDTATEISNLQDYGFMYDSGKLKYVTDRNQDGHLELWLEGTICECDGDESPTETCNCTGTTIVENFNGKLREYGKK